MSSFWRPVKVNCPGFLGV